MCPGGFSSLACWCLAGLILHTNSKDEAFCPTLRGSRKDRFETQQNRRLRDAAVADSIDPLADLTWWKALTNELERKAMSYIEKIDAMEELLRRSSRGYIQKEIADSAYQYQKEIETNQRIPCGR